MIYIMSLLAQYQLPWNAFKIALREKLNQTKNGNHFPPSNN
jgi:hypothetical protein